MPNWEEIRKEWEATKITFKALAEKHDVKEGTLKSRRSREGWSRNKDATKKEKDATTKKDATPKSKKDATIKKNDAPTKKQINRSGNPDPKNQFTKRNSAAVTHGFFAKFLPSETLEIMEQMQERSPADLIYDQIQIQYAAIIRAQQIMFVKDKDDTTKVLSKVKGLIDADDKIKFADEKQYDYQFAWDKHATFLNAQSRAMGEFRSLIKQFNEMAHYDDERRLKLEQMQVGINKTKIETDKIAEENKQVAPPTINIVDSWSDDE